jgi:hypothetical protein
MMIRGALALLLVSGSAVAGERIVTLDRTCVEIDAATDGLEPPDRDHAMQLIARVLEREDQLVVANNCTETYTLSHERTGEQYVIRLRSSAGKRRMTTPALSDLFEKYDRMVRSLIEAKAEAQAPQVAADPQVAVAETAQEPFPTPSIDEETPTEPKPRKNSLWYGMLGVQLTGGSAGSIGYRHRRDGVALDVAIGFRASDEGNNGASFGGKLLGMRQASPSTALYAGGGISLGTLERGNEYDRYDSSSTYYYGSGLQGDFAAGMQMGSRTQFITQLEISLPFYRLGNNFGDKTYAPTAMLTAGLGF